MGDELLLNFSKARENLGQEHLQQSGEVQNEHPPSKFTRNDTYFSHDSERIER